MLSEFENFVKNRKLFTRQSKLLLAISGGADSVCLFHLLLKGGYKFSVAHCNFGLRGKDSDADESFVRRLAARHGIHVYSKRFDTKQESQRLKKGTQETARILRYDWFRELCAMHGYCFLLTAHHLSDNTETMLINMLRSGGVSGLHGIRITNGNIVRPLMFASRHHIEGYLKSRRLAFRKDASNDSDDYLRNRIRHHIIPAFQSVEPATDKAFAAVAAHVADFELLSGELLRLHMQPHTGIFGSIIYYSDAAFNGFEKPLLLLFYLLKPLGFRLDMLQDFAGTKTPATGAKLISSTHTLYRERDGYSVMPHAGVPPSEMTINGPGVYLCGQHCQLECRLINASDADFSAENTLYLDMDHCGFPLLIRPWKPSDRMQVLGMKGQKKISDILTDRKAMVAGRKNRLLICNPQGLVMALLPDVCSELYRLHKSSVRVLAVRVNTL